MNRLMATVAFALLAACSKQPVQPGTSSETTATDRSSSTPLIIRDSPLNPTPLGFELDYANIEGVRSKLAGVAELEDVGTLEFSKGPVLVAKGTDLEVEDLKSAAFVFDDGGTLEGVMLTFPRGPQHPGATRKLAEQLGRKYQLVSKDFDSFLDHGSFRFEHGDAWIEIQSPHLSFEMTAMYGTKSLIAAFDAMSAESSKVAREKKEAML